ncbi:hypothetical protein D2E71_25065 [Mycobacteroides abscessus]|nr:hypothetical protein D2E71_25065 [Mycobacteroides abscessus]
MGGDQVSARHRIADAADDAGWSTERHDFLWLYSAPGSGAAAIATQYTVTGQPRAPLVRIGATLRPITGRDKAGQIIAIIQTLGAAGQPETGPPTRPPDQTASPPRPQGEHGGTAAADAAATAPERQS